MAAPGRLEIPVSRVAEHLELRRMNPGFDDTRTIEGSTVFYAGLAMAGYLDHIPLRRVVLMGESELGYLQNLPEHEARAHARRFLELDLGCVLSASEEWVPSWFVELATASGVGVYYTRDLESAAIQPRVSEYLREALAPRETVHGVMMDVSGIGVLMVGSSGIGKSECALELIKRGHRLVADDAVLLKRITDELVVAEPPGTMRHAMELRGIGLIDVRALFGMAAISDRSKVELVVRLEPADPDVSYERLGLDTQTYDVCGVQVPYLVIPVIEAKNLSALVEVAAMNQHLRNLGVHSARELTEELERRLAERSRPVPEP